MKLNLIRRFVCILAAFTMAVPSFAVTDKEMEEAKTITAQAYLRYANDGSGYLDEFKATTMSELKGKLKKQELENLKSFNSVKIPSDYASWDKARLVEFWSVTFFTSPDIIEKGKGARRRVKSRIENMEIGKPAAAPEPAAAPAKVDSSSVAQANPAASEPDGLKAMAEQDSILDEQMKVEEEIEELPEQNVGKKNSNTVIYLIILGVLIAAVIVLVVFASKTLKKSDERIGEPRDAGDDDDRGRRSRRQDDEEIESTFAMREKFAAALDAKNREISALRGEMQSLESENRRIGSDYERLKNDYYSLSKEIVGLREQNARLMEEIATRRQAASRPNPVQPAPQPAPQPKDEILHVIYLGKVNQKGIFVRADRKISQGNTIYRLDTDDGFVGTFRIVRNDVVEEMILMDPEDLIANGCTGKNLSDTDGKTRIITETPGTAIFENGCWKVLRKAKIRYE